MFVVSAADSSMRRVLRTKTPVDQSVALCQVGKKSALATRIFPLTLEIISRYEHSL